MSSSYFELVARTHAKLLESFQNQIFFSVDCSRKEEADVSKVVDKITRGSFIPTDSMKSGDDYSNLVHNIGAGAYFGSDKINLAYLVG